MTNDSGRQPTTRRVKSIHDEVPIWNDTPCCCAPEPRWQKLRDEQEAHQQRAAATDEGPDQTDTADATPPRSV